MCAAKNTIHLTQVKTLITNVMISAAEARDRRGGDVSTKSIMVICGTGVATSTVVATKIKEHCARRGIEVTVKQGKVMDLLRGNPDADLVVATTEVPPGVTLPVVAGLPFLTGVGLDAALDEIVSHLTP